MHARPVYPRHRQTGCATACRLLAAVTRLPSLQFVPRSIEWAYGSELTCHLSLDCADAPTCYFPVRGSRSSSMAASGMAARTMQAGQSLTRSGGAGRSRLTEHATPTRREGCARVAGKSLGFGRTRILRPLPSGSREASAALEKAERRSAIQIPLSSFDSTPRRA